jgi:hypothetical protein
MIATGLVSLPYRFVITVVVLLVATHVASAQPVTLALAGRIAGPAELVGSQSHYAFIASGSTLAIFDVANPNNPKRVGSYTFREKIWGFTVRGSVAYVAADFFGLGILDISDPSAPLLRGSLKTRGQAKNVAVSGTRAAVADHVAGVNIIDISNLAMPVLSGTVYLDGYSRDVASRGPLAYAVDNPSGLYVIDLSQPGEGEPVTSLQSADAPRSIKLGPGADGQAATFAVLVGAGSLQIYDLSNPVMPVHVSTFRASAAAQQVALRGTRAYLAAGSAGLVVVDLSTPATPRIIGGYKPADPVRDVAVSESHVFVVVGALPALNRTPLGGVVGPRDTPHGDVLILREDP